MDESLPVSVSGLTFAISGGTQRGQRTAKHLLKGALVNTLAGSKYYKG